MALKTKKDFPAIGELYISRVLSGEEMVCRKVRQSVERHVRDLERSNTDPDFPFYFDAEAGAQVCRLFELVQPSKWPTRMTMAPWMVTVTLLLYGWKYRTPEEVGQDKDGNPILRNMRRSRQAYFRWPRKTGKSAFLSVLEIFALVLDDERGAEVYSAALTEEQARRVFDEAVEMRNATPAIRTLTTTDGNNLVKALNYRNADGQKSICRPLSRDKETMEGLNVHFAACDEVHKWKNRGAWDVLRYGMRSRKQPMIVAITTAPSAEDNTSICNSLENYAEGVLNGTIPDERFFCWILEIDGELKNAAGEVIQEADKWDDETKWPKACPNLGVTVKLEDMRQEALEARNDADALNAFMRYSLNIRVDALEQPIPSADWNACTLPGDPLTLRAELLAKLKGRICFAALDLAIINDTSALMLLFPPMVEGEKWLFIPFFWIPEANIDARSDKDNVTYRTWRDQGFFLCTPGKTTDFNFIVTKILELDKQFDIRELAYDPALANGLIKLLLNPAGEPGLAKAGLTKGLHKDKVVKFAQSMMNYSAPCGDFVRAIARREIYHDGDPVLRWHITNLRWIKNHTGLFMPDKEKSIEKIDGAVAGIMAYGRATHPDNAQLIKPKGKVTVL